MGRFVRRGAENILLEMVCLLEGTLAARGGLNFFPFS